MEWQPIETAPKDGRDVILHCVMNEEDGSASHATMVGHFDQGAWKVMTGLQVGGFGFYAFILMPWTHWMPIPKPPARDTDE